jgi:hypothetical protein
VVNRTVQVVYQDVPADPCLFGQQRGVGQLALEIFVVRYVLAGVRLPGVDEDPRGLGVAGRRGIKQRTLCRAVRSSERAELHHQRPGPPKV